MSKSDGHWFSHDNNSAQDPKIVCLVAEYGFEGYGRFWRLLEICHSQACYKYSLTDKIAYASLAMMLGMTTDKLKDFLNYLINELNLLQTDGECLWNDSMLRRMEYWDRGKEARIERAKKGAAARYNNASSKESTSLSNASSNEKLLNETKQNETKQNETTPNNNNNTVDVDEVFEIVSSTDVNTCNDTTKIPPKLTLSQLRDNCIDDVEFTAIYTQIKGLPQYMYCGWLNAFNKWLVYTADTDKTETEYRKHFRNWMQQRNLATETPDTYNPVSAKAFSKPVASQPLQPGKKTPQQLIAERAIKERELNEKWKNYDATKDKEERRA